MSREEFSRFIRTHNWWSCKMPVFLAIGYATSAGLGLSLLSVAGNLLVLLAAVVAGAVFVSLLNDSTDVATDEAGGKKNIFSGLPGIYRWLLPGGAFGVCLFFLLFLLPDYLSAGLYCAALLAFCLYSVKPFRFKARGVYGVLCDACGAHLFPSLLMVTSCSYFAATPIDWLWFSAVGVWAFCFGLRGILLHQFADREFDLQAGVQTFAAQVSPPGFRFTEAIIMAVELAAFGFILIELESLLLCLALAGYAALVLTRARKLQLEIVLIRATTRRGTILLMNNFYQAYFPVCLILSASIARPENLLVLGLHLVLFPQNLLLVWNDGKLVVRKGMKILHLA